MLRITFLTACQLTTNKKNNADGQSCKQMEKACFAVDQTRHMFTR